MGEKYGFWGEEIGFIPDKLDYWDKFSYRVQEDCKYQDWLITFFVFVSPITKQVKEAETTEGEGIIEMNIEKVYKGEGFPTGSTKFLKDFNKYARNKSFN